MLASMSVPMPILCSDESEALEADEASSCQRAEVKTFA
jgi:hypothetical protein